MNTEKQPRGENPKEVSVEAQRRRELADFLDRYNRATRESAHGNGRRVVQR